MAWTALKGFDRKVAGTLYGMCLQNVRKGYGIKANYGTANEAWKHTQQHRDLDLPAGDIPLFYSYKSDGHVNVRLSSGQVWSDGTIYPNFEAYTKAHPLVHYLGWGESLNGVQIVQAHK